MLVEPQWLLEHLGDPEVLIVDARRRVDYDRGHIPGAIHLNVYDYMVEDTAPAAMPGVVAHIRELLAPLGLTNQTVVWYDQVTGMRETRGLWFLLVLGYTNTAVLHGGLQAWVQEGGALSQDPVERTPGLPDLTLDPRVLATLPDVLAASQGEGPRLLDVRDPGEYTGATGSACCPRNGRIPGAAPLQWSQFMGPDGRFRPEAELRQLVEAAGLKPDEEAIVYCHRGARSANTFLALRSLGYDKVRNYPGSWHEWSHHTELPLEEG